MKIPLGLNKKTNFILFVVFFLAIVLWIGIYNAGYLKKQPEISPPPSPVDMNNAEVLLETLKRDTGIPFSGIVPTDFEWRSLDSEIVVKGKKFEARGITNEEYNKVETFLNNQGFKLDVSNIASGAVSGLNGYKKNNIVCLVIGGSSGYKEAGEDWVPPRDKNDIEVMCGGLE